MKTKNIVILALLFGLFWVVMNNPNSPLSQPLTVDDKRRALAKWVKISPTDSTETKARITDLLQNQMTPDEIEAVFDFITLYFSKNRPLEDGTELKAKISEISTKYNIFT